MKSESMDYQTLMNVAIHAGTLMMENGAETYRVEDTINHILELSDKKDSSSLVIATGIMITFYEADKTPITAIRRIHRIGVNLNIIYLVNNLSRELCAGKINMEEAEKRLCEIEKEVQYGKRLKYIGVCGVASCFTFLVGGTVLEAVFALLIGIVVATLIELEQKKKLTKFFTNMLAGLTAALLARLIGKIAPFDLNSGIIVIGSIMPVLPGILFTNAIRDVLYGDYMAAVVRIAETVLVASEIALGVGIGIAIL